LAGVSSPILLILLILLIIADFGGEVKRDFAAVVVNFGLFPWDCRGCEAMTVNFFFQLGDFR
jgi:hypothetical protein